MSVTSNRSGKDTTRRAQQVKRLTLEETLQEIKRCGLILTPGRTGRIVPYAPNTRLAREVRSAIAQHNRELQRLMAQSDISVCVNSGIHRQEWDYRNKRYVCLICERLLPEVS
jgi:hypothetical protein